MPKRTLTPSEQAFDLLARLVKHTEPGGAFAFCTEAKSAEDITTRDNFLAEVEGLLMSRGNAAGETPPEILVVALQLALRELRATLAAANSAALPFLLQMEAMRRSPGDPKDMIAELTAALTLYSGAVARAGVACDQYLHSTGVPHDKARQTPSTKEIDDAFSQFGEGWCNCEKCRRDRAGDALAKLRKEGGAKSQ